jgi:ATP-binding cassette subfamily B multidrug efflux pump
LFTHIQTLPFSYFDSRPHGKILIRVVNYVNTLSDTLSSGLINVISDVFTFVITLVVMFVIDWQARAVEPAAVPVPHRGGCACCSISSARLPEAVEQAEQRERVHPRVDRRREDHADLRPGARPSSKTFQEQQSEVRSAWMRAVHIQFLMWPGMQTISVMTIAFIYLRRRDGLRPA